MTTPSKSTRAVIRTKCFLRALTDPSKIPGVPNTIRQRAEVLLRHFPCAADRFITATHSPESWGDLSAWDLEGRLDQMAKSAARASAAADDALSFIDASNRRIAAMESRVQVTSMPRTNQDNRSGGLV